MRYSSRNIVRKTHAFRPTGTVGVEYCILPHRPFRSSVPLPRHRAFNLASASPCCVYSTCSSPRLFYHLQFICLLPLCNAGLGSCLLQLHPPSLISLASQCLLCCFRLPLFSPSFPCLGSVFPLFCALFFLSLTSFDYFQSPFDFVGSRTIFEPWSALPLVHNLGSSVVA